MQRPALRFLVYALSSFLLVAQARAAYVIDVAAPAGDGSAGNPYLVETMANLAWAVKTPASWDKSFRVTADIDASDTDHWDEGGLYGFIGFGITGTPFTGVFDGGGHAIDNIYIYKDNTSNVGFFNYMSNAIVRDLHLNYLYVYGKATVGGLLGSGGGNTLISRCSVNGSVYGTTNVGLLAGNMPTTVEYCQTSGTVNGNSNVGGVGGNQGGGTILKSSSSSATVNVTGGYGGGLVGYSCEIEDSFFTGSVVGGASGYSLGGVVGYLDCDEGLHESYSTGAVSGSNKLGGLVGETNGPVWNSFASGDVTGTAGSVGGLVGLHYRQVTDSYATGRVQGTTKVGGLMGEAAAISTTTNSYSSGVVVGTDEAATGGLIGSGAGATVNTCFWDTTTSGLSSSAAGTGKTTAEMKAEATFTGWDFEDIWRITEGQTRPDLRFRYHTFLVSSNGDYSDAFPGDGLCADTNSGACTLRAAIEEASAGGGNYTVELGSRSIVLGSELVVGGATVTVNGTSAAATVLDGDNLTRIFKVLPLGSLTLNNLTIQNGSAPSGFGGGVQNAGTLNMNSVVVKNCAAADGKGGGVASGLGTVTIHNCYIHGNTAGAGGGIYNGSFETTWSPGTYGSMVVSNATVASNSATSDGGYGGGGIMNDGNLHDGYSLGATLRATNVTVSSNSGGGMTLVQGSKNYFVNCTIASNAGRGILGNGAPIHAFLNTIVTDECYQIATSNSSLSHLDPAFNQGVPVGYNLKGPASSCFFDTTTDLAGAPNLGPLADNGGFAPTHLPGAGSAAIDAGDPVNSPVVDQRGISRPLSGGGGEVALPDIGAVEAPGLSISGPPASISVPESDADGSYTVSWGASETAGATYLLQEATSDDFEAGLRAAYEGTELTASISGRAFGVTYYYRVRASAEGLDPSDWVAAADGCTVGTLALKSTVKAFKYNGASSSLSYTVTGGQPKGQALVTATTEADWIVIDPAYASRTLKLSSKGSAGGSVKYRVLPYLRSSPSSRTAVIQVGDEQFTVTQTGMACTVKIYRSSGSFAGTGGSGGFSVTAPEGCSWNASVDVAAPWITIQEGSSGEGEGTVEFTVTSNETTKSRTGKIYVTPETAKPSRKTFTVKEAKGGGT